MGVPEDRSAFPIFQGDSGSICESDYLDPVFLAKLDRFLAAMARRYDGNPNVAFIDIGSFGMWGEGHTGFSSRLDAAQTLAVVKRHIDLHRRHFKHTQLCLSDDGAGPSQRGGPYPAMDYALANGVSLRDDSILVHPPPDSWYHADMAQAFWPRFPVVLEHEHFGSSKQRQAWRGELLEKAVEDYHAAYLSIHWWPRELLAENRDTVARNFRDLKVGQPGAAPVRQLSSRFTVALPHRDPLGTHTPPTKPGVYEVFVAVGTRDGTPVIALPHPHDDGQRRYRVGQLTLK
jgi:hypothetical protein